MRQAEHRAPFPTISHLFLETRWRHSRCLPRSCPFADADASQASAAGADNLCVRVLRFSAAATLVLLTALGATAEEPSPSRAALGQLKVGNERFVKNASAPVSLSAFTRQSLVAGQTPFAMVLSCADSRVPPEHIFNAGLGDLFVVRAAGEVVDRSIMATLEYAPSTSTFRCWS